MEFPIENHYKDFSNIFFYLALHAFQGDSSMYVLVYALKFLSLKIT